MELLSKGEIRRLLKADGLEVSDDALESFLDASSDSIEPLNGVLIRKRGRGVDPPAPGGRHAARWYDVVSDEVTSNQANAAVAEYVRRHLKGPKDAWGYGIGTGAAAIDQILLTASGPLTEDQIIGLVKERRLKERGAAGNHLRSLVSRGFITRTPAGFVRTRDAAAVPPHLPAAEANEHDRDPGSYSPDNVDRRPVVERQIRERRGQQEFRDNLRRRYGDQCVVTGCAVLAVLEAAHINPYRGESDNHPENGLLLRADIHTLFDLDLMGIDPETLLIQVHASIEAEYGFLTGQALRCPAGKRPSPEALEIRYLSFCERRESGGAT